MISRFDIYFRYIGITFRIYIYIWNNGNNFFFLINLPETKI